MKTARVVRIMAGGVGVSALVAAGIAVGCSSTANDLGSANDSGGTWLAAEGGSPPTTGGSEAGGSASNDGGTSAARDANVGDATSPRDATSPSDASTTIPGVDAQAFSGAGADASIVAFESALICFGAVAGAAPCSRHVDAPVTFPTTGSFSQILMHVTLTCPSSGGCDRYDRVGSIDLVPDPSTDGGVETLIELGRFVTPFNIVSGVNSPPAWDIDVTELRPLLSGNVTLRAFIDTWDPQGDPGTNGGGWVLGATFEMTGGTPAKAPVVVLPIWTWTTTGKEPTQVPYGDATQPIASSLPPQSIELPTGPASWGVRSIITGHGQANLDNCAEFCSRNHTWTVGTTANQATVFRTDCQNYPSSGTYTYSRGGWCPGTFVVPWDFDVTSQVNHGAHVRLQASVPRGAGGAAGRRGALHRVRDGRGLLPVQRREPHAAVLLRLELAHRIPLKLAVGVPQLDAQASHSPLSWTSTCFVRTARGVFPRVAICTTFSGKHSIAPQLTHTKCGCSRECEASPRTRPKRQTWSPRSVRVRIFTRARSTSTR